MFTNLHTERVDMKTIRQSIIDREIERLTELQEECHTEEGAQAYEDMITAIMTVDSKG